MTQKERWQWGILVGLILMLLAIIVWNVLQPNPANSGRIPVIHEVLRRQR